MNLYESLFGIARLLLAEDDDARAPELILLRVLEIASAERGFIIVRENDSYEQVFDVRFDRNDLSSLERHFSRSLVRRAIADKAAIYSPNVAADSRFLQVESLEALAPRAVLVLPLLHAAEVFGVVYLQRGGTEGFGAEARGVLAEFATVAGGFLRRAIDRKDVERKLQAFERDLFAKFDFEGIITRDAKMIELLRVVAQIADAPATVLVRGENGTGKELIARALHVNSARAKKPFVPLHITALASTVLESELFGHARGAFTGAERERGGRIASASGGTLFLDEVAEIPHEIQAKLLRFLQFGEIQRLGSDKVEKIDVRIVAATHRDLAALVKEGTFRQDLYFRLKVIEVEVPPLRERRGDISLLVEHFFERYWRRPEARWQLTSRSRDLLESYPWPGNVRELQHVVERASLLATGFTIDVDLLPPEIRAHAGAAGVVASRFDRYTLEELDEVREASSRALEGSFLEGLMKKHDGNVTRAAQAAGMNRTHLQKLLARHKEKGD